MGIYAETSGETAMSYMWDMALEGTWCRKNGTPWCRKNGTPGRLPAAAGAGGPGGVGRVDVVEPQLRQVPVKLAATYA